MSRGIGIVQEQVLRVVTLHEPISMTAIRARVYPDDYSLPSCRQQISRAVKSLIRRKLVEKVGKGARRSPIIALNGLNLPSILAYYDISH
jgi:hypothetical protein